MGLLSQSFAVSLDIEQLAQMIQQSKLITGITDNNQIYTISSFIDSVMISLPLYSVDPNIRYI